MYNIFRFIKSVKTHWMDMVGGAIVVDLKWMVTTCTDTQHTVPELFNWCQLYDREPNKDSNQAEDGIGDIFSNKGRTRSGGTVIGCQMSHLFTYVCMYMYTDY